MTRGQIKSIEDKIADKEELIDSLNIRIEKGEERTKSLIK